MSADNLVDVEAATPRTGGVAIPAPTLASGMTAAEIARWHENMAILAADARTAGTKNRPGELVETVLRDARTMTAQKIAKAIRDAIKAAVQSGELPKVRYTVRQTWSGYTPSIRVAIKGWTGDLFNGGWLEHLALHNEYPRHLERFTPEAMTLSAAVERIAGAWNYDESRPEVDYFNCGYYLSVVFADAAERQVTEAKALGFGQVAA